MPSFAAFDSYVFQLLVAQPTTSVLLKFFGIFCAKFLIFLLPAHLLWLWFFSGAAGRKLAIMVLMGAVFACIINYLIGHFYFRPRPFMLDPSVGLLAHKATASFPSSHAAIWAAYLYALYRVKWYKFFLVGLLAALLTGWARVFVGLHYPLDILGGLVIGGICGYLAHYAIVFVPKAWYCHFRGDIYK